MEFDPLDSDQRARIIEIMGDYMPICYTGGLHALQSWADEGFEESITLKSPTARKICFYLGPARRYYGDPDATLKKGKGRVALLLDRNLATDSWKFSPYDIGEVLYHWRQGRIMGEYLSIPALWGKPDWEYDVGGNDHHPKLNKFFKTFLDEGYENPWNYLKNWIPPRPSIVFPPLQNTIYRAASDRLFGRVRGFAPAWTFELRADNPTRISNDNIIAVVVIDDKETRSRDYINNLREHYGEKWHTEIVDDRFVHPDLYPMILDLSTTHIIITYLNNLLNDNSYGVESQNEP